MDHGRHRSDARAWVLFHSNLQYLCDNAELLRAFVLPLWEKRKEWVYLLFSMITSTISLSWWVRFHSIRLSSEEAERRREQTLSILRDICWFSATVIYYNYNITMQRWGWKKTFEKSMSEANINNSANRMIWWTDNNRKKTRSVDIYFKRQLYVHTIKYCLLWRSFNFDNLITSEQHPY